MIVLLEAPLFSVEILFARQIHARTPTQLNSPGRHNTTPNQLNLTHPPATAKRKMASSTFTSFAIIGAGGVGATAAVELLKSGHKVTILTRDDTKAELHDLKNRGAVLVKVSYDDQESLRKALSGSQVVCVADRLLSISALVRACTT